MLSIIEMKKSLIEIELYSLGFSSKNRDIRWGRFEALIHSVRGWVYKFKYYYLYFYYKRYCKKTLYNVVNFFYPFFYSWYSYGCLRESYFFLKKFWWSKITTYLWTFEIILSLRYMNWMFLKVLKLDLRHF